MNKISLICSNYNSDKWIDEYLQYVNNQIFKEFDIIFVDANSTDQSLEKIKNYKFDSKINKKIIQSDRRIGLYEAWNIAIRNCTTEYVMNYNTDDMLYNNAILIYNNHLINNPEIDLFYGPCVSTLNRNINDIHLYYDWPEYSHETMLQFCFCGPFPLVKKEVFNKIGYFDERFISSGDYEMWLRMSKFNCKFKRIPEVIGVFHFRQDSINQSNKQRAIQEDILIQQFYK